VPAFFADATSSKSSLMRLRPSVTAAFLLASMLSFANARAEDFIDVVRKLTRVDTPESQAIDQEVDKLVETYIELNAKFLATPIGLERGKLMAEADRLRTQAVVRAEEAGKLRAQAANKKLCLAPSAGGSSVGGQTSSYLCGSVGGAEPGDTPNDPWVVCACGRRYLEGLRGEAEAISRRAAGFTGTRWPVRSYHSGDYQYPRTDPLSAEMVALFFEPGVVPASDRYIGRLGLGTQGVGEGGWSFLTLAEHAQKQVARLGVHQRTSDLVDVGKGYFATPEAQATGLLRPAKRDVYSRVQEAVRLVWTLHQREAALRMAAIEEALVGEVEKAERPFVEHMGAILQPIYEEDLPYEDRDAKIREAEKNACPGWVAGMMPHIEDAIAAAREVAAELYATRRRLIADAEAWKTFGLKDGAGSGPEAGTEFNDEDFAQFIVQTLGLNPLPFGSGLDLPPIDRLETGWTFWVPSAVSQDGFGPWCMWPGFFLSDPLAGYWRVEGSSNAYSYGDWSPGDPDAAPAYNALVLKAAQARFPEIETIDGHGGDMWLRFPPETEGQVSEAVVSGAGVGQGP
jgi:hypothetical protein